ncbi:MAG: M48 family metallopeptidase [Rubrivivax sp.]|nr:M48 family metallopeptidase [Rubrivivax sp.]
MDREETRLRRSPFRMREEPLASYLTQLTCALGGSHCADLRVYPVRAPYFNANMAPNGTMQVWSGLLLRVENEAQLAAVIGHEIGHYLRRHTLEMMRDLKSRSALGTFLGMFGLVGLVGQLANAAGMMAFSRDKEREADRISLLLMRGAGYDTREASRVWANLLAEMKATPGADPTRTSVLFASHPPSDERRQTLEQLGSATGGRTGEAEFRAVLAPLRYGLLEDELKRDRPFESVALLGRLLEREPGQPELQYFRGEALLKRGQDGDVDLAMLDLHAAADSGRAPPTTHRALGFALKRREDRPAARMAFQRYLDQAPAAPDAALIQQSIEELK